jgi:hypothetical protein
MASSTGTGAGVFQTSPTINTPTLATPSLTGTSTFAGGVANAYGFGVGTAVPSSGAGISFPATQSASSNANTLDDYEEGSWTPSPSSGSVTVNGSSYVKIGRFVFVSAQVTATANTGGDWSGLPFPCTTPNVTYYGSGYVGYQNANASTWNMAPEGAGFSFRAGSAQQQLNTGQVAIFSFTYFAST